MSDFAEVFKECIKNKDKAAIFEKNLERFFLIPDVQEMTKNIQSSYCVTENDIKDEIREYFENRKYNRDTAPKFTTFNRYIQDEISSNIKDDGGEENEKAKLCNSIINKYVKRGINDKYSEAGKNKGIHIINNIFDIVGEERIDCKHFLSSLMQKSDLEDKSRQAVDKLMQILGKTNPKIMRALVSKLLTFSEYTRLIEYIMENQKLNVPNLIIDFNKVRDYLSILLKDEPRTKDEFIDKCNWKKISSYEKEVFRISSIFGIQRGKFLESKKELENYKSNEFSKIYDIHNVPNIIANFMILDILQTKIIQGQSNKGFKLQHIIGELSSQIKNEITIKDELSNKSKKSDPIKTFKKYTLLPRIKEMEEYGFITIDKEHKDKYYLKAKFLNKKQKDILRFVVPFFCGVYPFASIGHFLANRLDIDDKFIIKPFNVSNILDDCITYNLLEVINNKNTVRLVFKNENNYVEIEPKELFIENKTNLLKIKSSKQEYYLRDIAGFAKDKLSDLQNAGKKYHIESPVFSEIYSFYYKVFEDSIKQYKKDMAGNRIDKNKKDFTEYFPEKYKTYKKIFSSRTFNELLPALAKLENYTIPLTTLELRWLKTIMQDSRFDLFVDADEKSYLEVLVNDIDAFDFSYFKIYDYKIKNYKKITDFGMPKGITKELFRKNLKELNTILFSLKDNSFPKLSQ